MFRLLLLMPLLLAGCGDDECVNFVITTLEESGDCNETTDSVINPLCPPFIIRH